MSRNENTQTHKVKREPTRNANRQLHFIKKKNERLDWFTIPEGDTAPDVA